MDTIEDLRKKIPTASWAHDQVQQSIAAKNLQTELELLAQFKDCIFCAIDSNHMYTSVGIDRDLLDQEAYRRVVKTLEEKGYTVEVPKKIPLGLIMVHVMVHWN